jgi:hypothetical protein
MIFKVMFDSNKVEDSVILAEEFLRGQLHCILSMSEFKYTDQKPEQVFNHISSCVSGFDINRPLLVTKFKTKLPWSTAIGQTTELGYEINSRKINSLTVPVLVGNAVHEFTHKPCGYEHPFFSTKDRPLSVSYWLGNQANLWAKKHGY